MIGIQWVVVEKKLLKYLTQPCMTHCSATICQQVTLSGGAGWPKVAGAVIKAEKDNRKIVFSWNFSSVCWILPNFSPLDADVLFALLLTAPHCLGATGGPCPSRAPAGAVV